jgi:UDP-N-acetylglucosamine 2-epimerase (non-hydrolysing)
LIGTSSEALVNWVNLLLDDAPAYATMAQAKNPFGDGHAVPRILSRLIKESGPL